MASLQVRFYPNWFHGHYGLVFGERYARDVEYRVNLDMRQQQLLHERFGDLGLGNSHPQPDLNLRSVYKNIISVMFGAQLISTEDDDGWIKPGGITLDRVTELKPVSVETDPSILELTRQAEWFEKRFGPALLNPGIDGILNCALNICGDPFLTWLVEEPKAARYLLGVLRETTLRVHDYFHRLCGRPAPMGLGNCSVCMISPDSYEKIIMPYDLPWCRRAQELNLPFGFHLDGKVDPFLKVIRKFPYLHRVDMGSDSDIALAREILGNKIFRVYLYPHQIQGMDKEQLIHFLKTIFQQSGEGNELIFQLDVSLGMSDELIRTISSCINKF
jgi:hypothetical protein